MKTIAFLSVFLFASLFKMQALQQQQQPKDCVKHPQIVKQRLVEKPKAAVEKATSLTHTSKSSAIPHFSVFNFINLFYAKDTLDNLRVM